LTTLQPRVSISHFPRSLAAMAAIRPRLGRDKPRRPVHDSSIISVSRAPAQSVAPYVHKISNSVDSPHDCEVSHNVDICYIICYIIYCCAPSSKSGQSQANWSFLICRNGCRNALANGHLLSCTCQLRTDKFVGRVSYPTLSTGCRVANPTYCFTKRGGQNEHHDEQQQVVGE